ncbi:GGDEF domain-containing protein [Xaviernesmea oryzae]|uniref:GGDEF domain-containing protein n=1 Tax=Xaviernesmea oryzae TaxID=464029 RepID=UPI0008C81BD4|nr:GGDEF domain-containing protein [Xaviernesmea oryzae]SEK30230.1 diguanylate cyclase (GGDEF) domain-containing protein [Xaviernesmea oryzae]
MDDLGFILPLTMMILGLALLSVGLVFSRPALFWGLGYLAAACGFAMPLQAFIPPLVAALLTEALFLSAFFFYGQALMTQFPGRSILTFRLSLSLIAYGAIAAVIVVLKDMELEFRLSDLACALSILVPILCVIRRPKTPVGLALVTCAGLVALETVTRLTLTFLLAGADPSTLTDSPYMMIMQGCAALFGHLMALAALAHAARDRIVRYREDAEQDALTGLLNRRGFERALAPHGERGHVPSGAVILCDIDHFKRINDTLGHAAGDAVIMAFARMMRASLPAKAAVARHGGEEFIAFLPGSSSAEARSLSQTLRLRIAKTEALMLGEDWVATASFGVSGSLPDDLSLTEVIGRADRALYRAKHQGRDQVVEEPMRSAA